MTCVVVYMQYVCLCVCVFEENTVANNNTACHASLQRATSGQSINANTFVVCVVFVQRQRLPRIRMFLKLAGNVPFRSRNCHY
uniref:Putative secreted protein n=1 Tax=Anopheles darlingi TaxID=43151 RepID=A0A2M4DHE3_ANODA